MSPASLLNLPPELLLEIGDFLPQDGILALKFTNKVLYYTLPPKPRFRNTTLSDCARRAIHIHLALPDSKPSHMQCILCKTIYPASSFKDSIPIRVPIPLEQGTQPTDAIELPHGVCTWHQDRLSRVTRTKNGGPNEWSTCNEMMCMHCGAIQKWDPCDCDCDSCAFRQVKTYTYIDNNPEGDGEVLGGCKESNTDLDNRGEVEYWVSESSEHKTGSVVLPGRV